MKKSIVEDDPSVCYVCGCTEGLQRHHIFGGNRNKTWSERYGLTVHLCYRHHLDHHDGVHFDTKLAERLHQEGQRAFERKYPDKVFRDIFGINYVDAMEEELTRDIPVNEGIGWLRREE